jgi:hypothetical protein
MQAAVGGGGAEGRAVLELLLLAHTGTAASAAAHTDCNGCGALLLAAR